MPSKAEKKRARVALKYAVTHGKIVKPNTCTACKQPALIQAHHTDYTKPLDVTWLCRPCHLKEHGGCPAGFLEKSVKIRATKEMMDAVSALAAEKGIAASTLIRNAIVWFMAGKDENVERQTR